MTGAVLPRGPTGDVLDEGSSISGSAALRLRLGGLGELPLVLHPRLVAARVVRPSAHGHHGRAEQVLLTLGGLGVEHTPALRESLTVRAYLYLDGRHRRRGQLHDRLCRR
jgi:hypothetical protein